MHSRVCASNDGNCANPDAYIPSYHTHMIQYDLGQNLLYRTAAISYVAACLGHSGQMCTAQTLVVCLRCGRRRLARLIPSKRGRASGGGGGVEGGKGTGAGLSVVLRQQLRIPQHRLYVQLSRQLQIKG